VRFALAIERVDYEGQADFAFATAFSLHVESVSGTAGSAVQNTSYENVKMPVRVN
jgi:hypothetical protein